GRAGAGRHEDDGPARAIRERQAQVKDERFDDMRTTAEYADARAMPAQDAGDVPDNWLFLAMAYWQQGAPELALGWYDRGGSVAG
ncbi:MAG TPA: hypothetical protein VKI65_05355, partial [Gemmataceae bacterium]|nr:hypothetical protein [Gemmataceae bacterium]